MSPWLRVVVTGVTGGLVMSAYLLWGGDPRVRAIWRRWRDKGPTEPCEVCAKPLTAKHRVEVVDVSVDDWGGSGMIATYCKAHAPREASA